MNKVRCWRIEGFDGTTKVFETSVPVHRLSKKQAEEVLMRLASRHLTENEIVDSSLNRRGKKTALLDIHHDGQSPPNISCGENPHYIARIVEK